MTTSTQHRRTSRPTAILGSVVGAVVAVVSVPLVAAAEGTIITARVSVGSDGTQGNGPSDASVVSADGRYVAFHSNAANLVAADSNAVYDVFVHDRQSGRTTRISVAADGTQGDRNSTNPDISGDGRFITFASSATTLVPGVSGQQVYLHDRDTDADGILDELGAVVTTVISVDGSGVPGGGESPAISADGNSVAFASYGALLPGDTNGVRDVYVYDRLSRRITRASDTPSGGAGDKESGAPDISADGRAVAFTSDATNLVAGDVNGVADVFVRDRDTDADGVFDEPGGMATTRESVASGGVPSGGASFSAAISGNGRQVGFESVASLAPTDSDINGRDVYVHDRLTGLTAQVNIQSWNESGGLDGNRPALNYDGRFVVLDSANALVSGDNDGFYDAYLRDRDTDGDGLFDEPGASTTTLVSVASDGTNVNGNAFVGDLSADGRKVGFSAISPALVAGDTNGVSDIFVRAPAPADFTLAASPATQAVGPGETASYTIGIAPSGGVNGSVDFTVSGLPDGASATFTPNPASSAATLAVTTAGTTPAGTYSLLVAGTSGALVRHTTVTLVVREPPDFTLAASPPSQSVAKGNSTAYSVTITPNATFAGSVTLSVGGLPANTTANFSPNPATSSSTLTVTTTRRTRVGTYTLTITGESGGLTRATTVGLTVTRR